MRILYFDLETSPCKGWFWRPGYNLRIGYHQVTEDAKIICASWKWGDAEEIHHADWGPTKNDALVLKPLLKAMNKADLIIAHNGDRFDIPWVRTRALANGILTLPRWKSLDTLKSVRSNLKLPSNRLDDVGKYFGIGAKVPVDGTLWQNIVFGDQSRMQEMLDYCDGDITLLQSVHELIEGVVPHKIHKGVADGGEKWSCPACGSPKIGYEKERPTVTGTLKYQMRCRAKACRRYFTISGAQYIMHLKHRG